MKNNQVTLSGIITSEFIFSHEVYGEKFYIAYVKVERISEAADILPVMFSDRIINTKENYINESIYIVGEIRSYNQPDTHRNRLILNVFVLDYEFVDDLENLNTAALEGFICRKPIYRKTPLGREIADVLLAVNRPYGKSDYIPCICWGRNARYADTLDVGTRIRLQGRIQSREYTKDEEIKTAYEFSVAKLQIIE